MFKTKNSGGTEFISVLRWGQLSFDLKCQIKGSDVAKTTIVGYSSDFLLGIVGVCQQGFGFFYSIAIYKFRKVLVGVLIDYLR